MKKLISMTMVFVMLLSLMSGTVLAADRGPVVIAAENVRVRTNSWATVTLWVEQNPGFQGMSFYPVITDARGNKVNWSWGVDNDNSDFSFDMNVGTMVVLTSDADQAGTGCLLQMHFFVGEEVKVGEYTISFQLYRDECFNVAGDTLSVALPRVTVNVKDFVYGDVNGDWDVNLRDVLLLRQYLANRDPETGESTVSVEDGADANGDGSVTLQDALLLRQYLANRNLETGESTVVLGPPVPEVPAGFKQAEYNTTTAYMPSNWNGRRADRL